MTELDLQIACEFDNLPSFEQFQLWADKALSHYREDAELTIVISDEAQSQQLNNDYRGKDKPTNVLSFPFEAPQGLELPLLGDLVICRQVFENEAIEQQKPVFNHWAHLVIHGILHLRGYDHIDDDDAEEMESMEIDLLTSFSIPNPYLINE